MKKTLILSIVFLAILFTSCGTNQFKKQWVEEQAPPSFSARFETTQGNFEIVAIRSLSPKAVDRLYQLISRDFYTDIAIFRVVPNFVAQFGIYNDSLYNKKWEAHKVPDEKVKKSNEYMTISFARAGVETRSTQLFINLKDNKRLDTLTYGGVEGFPVIAIVTEGEETIKKFYDGYAEAPSREQDSIYIRGNDYLRKHYPKLDYITKAYILK